MTDTHTHLYSRQYEGRSPEIVERAFEAGVTRLVFPAVSLPGFGALLALHDRFPRQTAITVGMHPTDLHPGWAEDVEKMIAMCGDRRIAGVGEVGIDLHWDTVPLALQQEAFYSQLELAWQRKLPVVIHSRDAFPETLEVIKRFKENHSGELPELIFHSFTGTPEDVKAIREICDPWFGINGVVTFKNSGRLPEAVAEIGLPRLLLETDSPYLSPVPWRGQRNESSRLPAICDRVADILGLSREAVEAATDRSAAQIFKFTDD